METIFSKQLVWLLSAICSGIVVALWLNVGVWELRHRGFKWLTAVGYLGLAVIIFCFYAWWMHAGDQGIDRPINETVREQQHWKILFSSVGLLILAGAFGLYDQDRFKIGFWDAGLAVFGKIFLALLTGCIFLYTGCAVYSALRLKSAGLDDWVWIVWFALSYIVSILCLSVARRLKTRNRILQTCDDWFSLN